MQRDGDQICDKILRRNIKDAKTIGKALAEATQKLSKPKEAGAIENYMTQLETDLNDTEGMVVSLAQTVESEIAGAMSSAITGLIDGTKTAEEAFADMFANIGKAFIDMATKMIAKALIMKALGILTGGGDWKHWRFCPWAGVTADLQYGPSLLRWRLYGQRTPFWRCGWQRRVPGDLPPQ